ncbi:2'-5' RNA ligase family protein [Flavobacterium sp. GT3R68]|uniref:2'-5' RNA ligase family protein n=1 Tax=Flavobacterium sp. GT3R68 TaxID=2594437 RepID=UPI000F87305C|nr:2'-5' RNA ligase family protein [Flavobacterium sp. GT3R68]RTY90621.1 2'-5' RNA ligase family protein [Flavobacterium sp. GSN2]TRW89853.1 2'-5' RNA ligase family protein [Flavobacterium sp. GT3R68]
MQELYSIAISPSQDIISEVKEMKEKLNSEVGWFNSIHSWAHISINQFLASEAELETVKTELMAICDPLQPFEVTFNDFGTYPKNGAFFIAPDAASTASLKILMNQIHDSLQVDTEFKNNEPHISIARRLTPEKLESAKRLFPTVNLHYWCDSVVIRKFSSEKKQFDIVVEFKFKERVGLTI